jgi:NADP-dependent 3-hydroxy acid dehydrogenase YdfG
MFKTAVERFKSVDVVIANAGISGQDAVWKDGMLRTPYLE